MAEARLNPYLHPDLDVLFIALNPPDQSNSNGHWFSGRQSRFFELLVRSGLITQRIDRACADVTVFGTNKINCNGASFGVVDLVSVVETNSGRVKVKKENVAKLVSQIRSRSPRFACVIHSKVMRSLNRHGGFDRPLKYGRWSVLEHCNTEFIVNYFPNGNSIGDETKIRIFRQLRDRLR